MAHLIDGPRQRNVYAAAEDYARAVGMLAAFYATAEDVATRPDVQQELGRLTKARDNAQDHLVHTINSHVI